METWQKEVNRQWLDQVRRTLQDGGIWIWPATGFKYTLTDGKFIGDTAEADEALKAILP